ncbi:hypothetical protein GMA11_08785 [Granulicatella sp. zg-ZJ]|uniref:hypothetical protein n=1 Tax=Granulicatella sp. zg-ZJ TaxID=2678504 RepID=UPI0013D58D61|nr:hypothetical protein [Granulicatella sp. zg-ZJ]NEW63468.1 hypothetical protein [Granulicatella sp. zg-ZJ]
MTEPKRPRGRPATGKKRTVQLKIDVTADEKQEIKNAVKLYNKKGIADLILYFIRQ